MQRVRSSRWFGAGLFVMWATLGCSSRSSPPHAVAFHGVADPLPGFKFDTGWVPSSGPLQIDFAAQAQAMATVDADATLAGSTLQPTPGSGKLALSVSFSLSGKLNVAEDGLNYMGTIPGLTTVAIAFAGTQTFDPFLIGGSSTVNASPMATMLPPIDLTAVGLPGTTLNLVIAPDSQLSSTFSGTCTGVTAGQPVYIGSVSTTGTLKVSASLAFSALGISKSLPLPSEIAIPIPATVETIVMTTAGASGAAPTSCGSTGGDGGSFLPDSGVHAEGGSDATMNMSDAPMSMSDAPTQPDVGADASLVCPPQSTASYTAPAYVAAVANQNLCTATDIAAFVGACGDNATTTSFNDWVEANVAGDSPDGGAGTPCGNCIASPMNNGALWVDSLGGLSPNYGACIQLLDPSQGAACATAFDDLLGCTGVACDNACPMNDPNQATDIAPCFAAARQGSCMSYTAAEKAACASDLADGGAVGTCAPGTGTNKIDPDLTYIATLICGQ
jgi:hypothetical protein